MNECKLCKHYSRCSKDIYHANIERKYLIEYLNKDCWELPHYHCEVYDLDTGEKIGTGTMIRGY